MTDPRPASTLLTSPAPAEGFLVTLFITVRKVAQSRDSNSASWAAPWSWRRTRAWSSCPIRGST
jgi:hypothetical protein